ncbi:MAG: diaminopimelate epimerase [Planctomycetota bacterium]|nr:MAG: diaminopimelate epimerase [Planctomycetota bacterium]
MTGLRGVPGEGLGNTFLLVESEDLEAVGLAPAAAARRFCGRRYDGLLVLDPAAAAEPELAIWNRDGSAGGVCLNGLRMAALHLGRPAGAFRMAGRRIAWRRSEPNWVELHLAAEDLPASIPARTIELPGGRRGVPVPFWNPHCVVPVEDLEGADLEGLAAAAAGRRDLFPEGVNLELVAERPGGGLRMRVWERGVGETRACGSGAVAVALLAWADRRPEPLVIEMAGGALALGPAPPEVGGLLLAGPAAVGPPLELDPECRA